jgi:phosphatidate cytidylyltransferase
MKRVLTAVVLIPIVLLVVLKAPLWVFAAVSGGFALVSVWEYLNLARHFFPDLPRTLTLTMATLLCILLVLELFRGSHGSANGIAASIIFAILFLLPLLLLIAHLRVHDLKDFLPGVALAALTVPYILLPFGSLVVIRSFPSGWFFILWLFFMVWSGDIFAYYVGKNFGKRLIAPQVSPKKTWEGTIASVLGSAAVSWLLCFNVSAIEAWLYHTGVLRGESVFGFSRSLQAPPWWVPLVLAVIINIVAQAGDLIESAIKRGAGVKDSGSILPGHGGMLDRVDALLLAAPVAVLLFIAVLKSFATRS